MILFMLVTRFISDGVPTKTSSSKNPGLFLNANNNLLATKPKAVLFLPKDLSLSNLNK